MHTSDSSLGPCSPGPVQPQEKCILYLLCGCYCRSVGLLPCCHPHSDACSIEDWSEAEMGVEFPDGLWYFCWCCCYRPDMGCQIHSWRGFFLWDYLFTHEHELEHKHKLTMHFLDGVGTLFLWGEVEEWVVLITMSIPPVWPLFRPFTSRFIKSHVSRTPGPSYHYNYKHPGYSSTAVASPMSPNFPPPMVTTTISISSAKDGATTVVPSETGSRISDERTPHNILDKNDAAGTWVELGKIPDKYRRTQSPQSPVWSMCFSISSIYSITFTFNSWLMPLHFQILPYYHCTTVLRVVIVE